MEQRYPRRNQKWNCSSGGPPHDEAGAADCWFCRVNISMTDKFVALKTKEPVERKILRLQQDLGLKPGEPLSFANIHRLIPPVVMRYPVPHPNRINFEKSSPGVQERSKENDFDSNVPRLADPVPPKLFHKKCRPATFPDRQTVIPRDAFSTNVQYIKLGAKQPNIHEKSKDFPPHIIPFTQELMKMGPQKTISLLKECTLVPHVAKSTTFQFGKNFLQISSTASKKSTKASQQRHISNPHPSNIGYEEIAIVLDKHSTAAHQRYSSSPQITKKRPQERATVHEKLAGFPLHKQSSTCENSKKIHKCPASLSEEHKKDPNSERSSNSRLTKNVPEQPNALRDKSAAITKLSAHTSKKEEEVSLPELFSNPHLITTRPKSLAFIPVKLSNYPNPEISSTSQLKKQRSEETATASRNSNKVSHQRHSSNHHPSKEIPEETATVSEKRSKVAHQRHSSNPQHSTRKPEERGTVDDKRTVVSLPQKSTSSAPTKKCHRSPSTLPSKRTEFSHLEKSSSSQLTKNGAEQTNSVNDTLPDISKLSAHISKTGAEVSFPEHFSNPHLTETRPTSPAILPVKRTKVPIPDISSTSQLNKDRAGKSTTATEDRNCVSHQRHSSNLHPAKKISEDTATVSDKCSKVALQRHSSNPQPSNKRPEERGTLDDKRTVVSLPQQSTSSITTKKRHGSPSTLLSKRTEVSHTDHATASQSTKNGPGQPNTFHDKRVTIYKKPALISKKLDEVSIPELFSNPHLIKTGLEFPATFPNGRSAISLPRHSSFHQQTKKGSVLIGTLPDTRTGVSHHRNPSIAHFIQKRAEFPAEAPGKRITAASPVVTSTLQDFKMRPEVSASRKGVKRSIPNAEYPTAKKILSKRCII